MPTVTVTGANSSTVSLPFDTEANAALARQIASAISDGIAAGTIYATDNPFGLRDLPSYVTGAFVQTHSGVAALPRDYSIVVNTAPSAVIIGSGTPDEKILSGGGNLKFFALAGSGTVVTGGGNNLINIAPGGAGEWMIETGNGNDTIRALGGGNDTIGAGGGANTIQLGSGHSFVTTTGADTILAGSGSETIIADGSQASNVIYGNSSQLFFVANGGATVFGGTGSATVFGGNRSDLLVGGSGGHNFLQAGGGQATLFGGGDGDQLYAGGAAPQELHAAGGNETLFGGFASGDNTFYAGSGHTQITGGMGDNTFVTGAGAATINAGPASSNMFKFVHGAAGGTAIVMGLTDVSDVHILLSGYNPNETAVALKGQTSTGSGVTITLSDHTSITFNSISNLTSASFSSGDIHGDEHDGFGRAAGGMGDKC